MDIETPCGRRTLLRGSLGLAGVAAVGTPASAQTDPYDGWFDDVDNYEGTVDRTGEETVEVMVGAGDQGIRYDPPAIQVDPGTEVVWEWTGEGGDHNVVTEDGPAELESELTAESGHTYSFEFTDEHEGTTTYGCTPHIPVGMKGAVAVGDVVDETIGDDAGGDADTGGMGPLSSQGILATLGGVIGLALLSPLIFALLLKFVYEDDKPTEQTNQPRP